MKRSALRLLLGLWLACWAALAGAEVAVPPLKSRVTDLAGLLQADQAATLERQLAELESRKGSQLAILIVPTIQPETVEQYALRVAEQWKLGRKGVNDGALIVVARDDRKLRIEVGYGLEGAIPDAVAKRVVSETMAPRFKQQQYYEGLQAGVEQLAKLIDGEALPPPKAKTSSSGSSEDWWWAAFIFTLVGGQFLRSMIGTFFGSLTTGALVGGVAWWMTASALIGGVAGFIAFLITLVIASRSSGLNNGGGWTSSSSGGWSSSSSDSGFSGGGGDFGGGGASGDW